jgi:hypothetical protein
VSVNLILSFQETELGLFQLDIALLAIATWSLNNQSCNFLQGSLVIGQISLFSLVEKIALIIIMVSSVKFHQNLFININSDTRPPTDGQTRYTVS